MQDRKVLVTGAAGFIGAFLVKRLLETTDDAIIGLDNVNSYYDPGIKEARLRMLAEVDKAGRFAFVRGDLCDAALIERLFAENGFDVVVNLAAQAGVRYSIENPKAYIDSNQAPPGEASCLRELFLRLRRQRESAFLGGRPCRLSGEPVRRHKEVQRANGRGLLQALLHPSHGPALLYGVWAHGKARHGILRLHREVASWRYD